MGSVRALDDDGACTNFIIRLAPYIVIVEHLQSLVRVFRQQINYPVHLYSETFSDSALGRTAVLFRVVKNRGNEDVDVANAYVYQEAEHLKTVIEVWLNLVITPAAFVSLCSVQERVDDTSLVILVKVLGDETDDLGNKTPQLREVVFFLCFVNANETRGEEVQHRDKRLDCNEHECTHGSVLSMVRLEGTIITLIAHYITKWITSIYEKTW